MRSNINSIEDLQAEKIRLKGVIALSKANMQQDISAIKHEISPARQTIGVINNLLTSPKRGILNIGVGLGVDLILRRGLLARAGFLPRLIVPFLVRNASVNYIEKNSNSLTEKGLRWLKKITEKKETATAIKVIK
jgi:hypothetical protein